MLYRYTYPENHSLADLNSYFVEFINNIRTTVAGSQFRVNIWFNEDFVNVLEISPQLKNKFRAFFTSFKILPQASKDEFVEIVNRVQDISQFFEDTTTCCVDFKTDRVNEIIGNNTFKELASQLFKSLKVDRWDIKGHYKAIYDAMPHKVCPFCGVEIMLSTFREDYDHLAPKRHYPLIAVHPKNLAPMCHTCNSKNKGEKDVLYNADGERKAFLYPYSSELQVEFDYSTSTIPQTELDNPEGEWRILFDPDNDETRSWNDIFNIKRRYIEDFIEPDYEVWIDDFVNDCIEDGIALDSILTIKEELRRLYRRFKRKWYEQANIIKGPLFEFLCNCDNNLFYDSLIKVYNRKMGIAA